MRIQTKQVFRLGVFVVVIALYSAPLSVQSQSLALKDISQEDLERVRVGLSMATVSEDVLRYALSIEKDGLPLIHYAKDTIAAFQVINCIRSSQFGCAFSYSGKWALTNQTIWTKLGYPAVGLAAAAFDTASTASRLLVDYMNERVILNIWNIYNFRRSRGDRHEDAWEDAMYNRRPAGTLPNIPGKSEAEIERALETVLKTSWELAARNQEVQRVKGEIREEIFRFLRPPVIRFEPSRVTSWPATILESGSGFTPNSIAKLHIEDSRRQLLTEKQIPIDAQGSFEIRFDVPADYPQGTSFAQVTDGVADRRSNRVAYIVWLPISGTWRGQWLPIYNSCARPPYSSQEIQVELHETNGQVEGQLSGPGIRSVRLYGTRRDGNLSLNIDAGLQPPDGRVDLNIEGLTIRGVIKEYARTGLCNWQGSFVCKKATGF